MGFFDKIKSGLTKTRDALGSTLGSIFSGFSEIDDDFYDELEECLILADLGVETAVKATDNLRSVVKSEHLKTTEEAKQALKQILVDMLAVGDTALNIGTKPSVVLVIGVNGVGKTTTIGKIAAQLTKQGKNVLLVAGDTFRAAAADQLEIWADRAGAAIVRQHEGADPASVVFDGIQAYAGHLSHAESLTERSERSKENADKLRELIRYLQDNNVSVNTVSGGSTGTSVVKVKDNLYTELQAGSYLFMDATYDRLGLPFKPSLFILATVVSVSNGIAVVDAGVKSCGVDQGMPLPMGFTVSEVVASEEHFQLHNPSKELSVGEKVFLLPAHCCSTVNLHNHIFLIERERVIDRISVTARGYFH